MERTDLTSRDILAVKHRKYVNIQSAKLGETMLLN